MSLLNIYVKIFWLRFVYFNILCVLKLNTKGRFSFKGELTTLSRNQLLSIVVLRYRYWTLLIMSIALSEAGLVVNRAVDFERYTIGCKIISSDSVAGMDRLHLFNYWWRFWPSSTGNRNTSPNRCETWSCTGLLSVTRVRLISCWYISKVGCLTWTFYMRFQIHFPQIDRINITNK